MHKALERDFRCIGRFGERQILLLAFLISLVGRLVVILLLGQEQNLYEYGGIAQNLVSGNGFSFDAFPPATPVQETCMMSPVYPFLLAGSYYIFSINLTAILFIQIIRSIVGAATVYPLYYLTKDCYSKRTATESVII